MSDVETTVARVLAEHFVMWNEVASRAPSGDWVCHCGLKFGFSDSAIAHVAAKVAEALAGPTPEGDDRESTRIREGVEALIAPGWRPNKGHEHDTTAAAYAAGRNDFIDQVRVVMWPAADGVGGGVR